VLTSEAMKTLLLMRHAKSAWGESDKKDIDRPLNERGRKAAARMGAWLAAEGYRPDVVLCSAAQRTRETLELMRTDLPEKAKVEIARALYLAGPREMLTEIGKVAATAQTVMLLGHNPGMGSLAGLLAGSGNERALADMHGKFPTAAIAVLGFNVAQWRDLEPGSGVLRAFVRPRDLD
jgi:phosphohistidine phosphatase